MAGPLRALSVAAAAVTAAACARQHAAGGAAPVVRVAFGWRAREVERQSTARGRFSD